MLAISRYADDSNTNAAVGGTGVAMEILSHLFHALGGILIWVASVLAVEELMFGGLALLLHLMASRPTAGSKKVVQRQQSQALKVQQ